MAEKLSILLIEDETKIADFVITGFIDAGMQVECCADGESGLSKALSANSLVRNAGPSPSIRKDVQSRPNTALAVVSGRAECGR